MAMAKVAYDTAVICEQIRPEPAGKFMLLGVIYGDLAMPSFPSNMAIAIYAEGEVVEEGDFASTFRVVDENNDVLSTLSPEAPIKFAVGRFSHRAQMSIPVSKPMTIRVFADTTKDSQKILTRKVVLFSPSPPLPLPPGLFL